MAKSRWTLITEENPGHSAWYIQLFKDMEAEGRDLGGEARTVSALVPPGSRVLDAGCGPGRVGGRLADMGYEVVGVDVDPVLIEAAEADYPGPLWMTGDLAQLDLPALGLAADFDLILAAGNVMTFLADSTRATVLSRLADHLADDGRLVVGFGADRGYPFETFIGHLGEAGLTVDAKFSTWDLRPVTGDDEFLVVIASPADS